MYRVEMKFISPAFSMCHCMLLSETTLRPIEHTTQMAEGNCVEEEMAPTPKSCFFLQLLRG